MKLKDDPNMAELFQVLESIAVLGVWVKLANADRFLNHQRLARNLKLLSEAGFDRPNWLHDHRLQP
jgi:hypothetical protein